jgi:Immunoglobulin I-set domain.
MGRSQAYVPNPAFRQFVSLMISACEPKNGLLLKKMKEANNNNFTCDEAYVDVELPEHQIVDETETEMNFSLLDPEILRARIIRPLPKNKDSAFGAQLVLTCLTTVLFPVEVDWLLNGQLIEPSVDGRVYFNEDRRQLVILYLTYEDEGTIEVVARNRFGSEKSKCDLRVVRRKSSTSASFTF